jgi:hypothetical protein
MLCQYPRLCVFAFEYCVFLWRLTNPSAKPPFLEDRFVALSLASLLRPVRLGRPYQEHKVVARPSLLYGSKTWVTTQRDMTCLEAAEMHFLRSVVGYTRLDKIRSEDIRQELEISGIQDMRLKYKQNWINHLERWTTPDSRNTPLPTNPKEEGIADVPGNIGNVSMLEKVKQPNPWRKMMMMVILQ